MRDQFYIEPLDQGNELAEIRAELIRNGLVVEPHLCVERTNICLCDDCLRERYLEVV